MWGNGRNKNFITQFTNFTTFIHVNLKYAKTGYNVKYKCINNLIEIHLHHTIMITIHILLVIL